MNQDTDFSGGILKIALGIFLGGLLLWMAADRYAQYQLRQLSASLQVLAHDSELRVMQARQERDARARAQRLHIEQQQAVLARQVAALQELRHRKDAAWSRFFQPSDECLRTSTVECGNAHIRAQREFERRYAAGDF